MIEANDNADTSDARGVARLMQRERTMHKLVMVALAPDEIERGRQERDTFLPDEEE